ncbi:MAG TPA: cytochrome c oxidase subunit II [Actinomycetota bacterium]|nr:cytochrome c oxidase subunit II [Actinomycetota bacterium]
MERKRGAPHEAAARRTGGRARVAALLPVFAMLLASCANQSPQDSLSPEGPVAREQDKLWDLTFLIAVVIFFIVELLLVYALVRFRERPGRQAAQFHGNTKLEVLLTVIPSLILAGIAVPTVQTIFDQAEEPEGALQVNVVGKQFWWEYEYVDAGVITANELHIPTDTPVHLTLDGVATEVNGERGVIHSFWVPRLAGAQDVIPGRTTSMNIQADEPGEYEGQCKEFCGLSHANMRLRVIAHEPPEFQTWLAEQQEEAQPPADELAQRGQQIFQETCVACHSIQGVTDSPRNVGPDLTHFASRETFAGAMFPLDEENLRAWMEDPPAVKPGSLMPDYNLSADEIDAVVAFLMGLE